MAGFDAGALARKVQRTASGFSTGQKILGAVVAVAVIGGVMLMSRMGGQATMAPLFTNLAPEDASALTKELDAQGVPYTIGAGGDSILVPEDRVYDTRIKVAAIELPSRGKVGYGVLDDQGLTTSEFGQRVGFQRAMEGELAKTIEAIDTVDTATVHLAIPADRVFALADEKPSASVLVRTKAGAQLSADQVRAIRNVVAGAIEGMVVDQVSVSDAEGRVLASPGEGVTAGGADGNQERTRAYEERVAESVRSLLAPTVGTEGVRVKVAADLNYDQRTVSSESFAEPESRTPNTRLTQNDTRKTETYTGANTPAVGQLGPDGQPLVPTGANGSNYQLDDQKNQYALNRTVETVNQAPGVLNRLSVAVLVDESRVQAEQVAAITELVSAGADLRQDRGDSVVVTRMPFDRSAADDAKAQLDAADKAKAEEAAAQRTQTMVLLGVVLVVLLLAFVSFRRSMKKRRLARLRGMEVVSEPQAWATASVTAPGSAALGIAEGVTDQVGAPTAPALAAAPTAGELGRPVLTPPAPLELGPDENAILREQRQVAVAELIDHQPEEVAVLLRGWLGDRRGADR